MAVNCNAKIAGDALDIRPANVGIGAEFLAFNEGDVTMAEMKKVLESDLGGTTVIEYDIGDSIDVVVARDGNDRDGKIEVPWRVDGDQTIDGALKKHAGILVDEIGAMAMAGDEVEVAFLQKIIFDAAHDRGGIAVADLGDDDSDGEAALCAKRAGEKVGAVLEFSGGGEDAIFGLLRNGIGNIGAVDHQGNSCGGKAEVLSQFLEADRSLGGARGGDRAGAIGG